MEKIIRIVGASIAGIFIFVFVAGIISSSRPEAPQESIEVHNEQSIATSSLEVALQTQVDQVITLAPIQSKTIVNQNNTSSNQGQQINLFKVVSVVDGDTIKVSIDGVTKTVRLIGIDTPETLDPRKPVQCFGKESSDKAKAILSNKLVRLEADSTQGEIDKYQRLLRYVFLEDGTFFNKSMIAEGYAHEYTYDMPYKYQAEFKVAEKTAREAQLGLWSPEICNGITDSISTSESAPIPIPDLTPTSTSPPALNCNIKGNITSEKIYHLPGCGSYTATKIDEVRGEKWFCTEAEAISAGWRKAKNCP